MLVDESFCNFGGLEETIAMVTTLMLEGIRGSMDEGCLKGNNSLK